MANTDHRLLDVVRGVFPDAQPRPRGHQHRDATRLAQLERGRTVLVHERLLDPSRVGPVPSNHLGQLLEKRQQPVRQATCPGCAHAVGNMAQPASLHVNHAPAEVSQTGVNAQYPHDRHPASLFFSGIARNGNKHQEDCGTLLIVPIGLCRASCADRTGETLAKTAYGLCEIRSCCTYRITLNRDQEQLKHNPIKKDPHNGCD